MKSIGRVGLMAAGIMLLALFCAAAMFLNVACDGERYHELQLMLDVEPGVDSETMKELDMLLARYLSGDRGALDETELFNADEKAHMEDVYDIFAALRVIKNAAFVISVLMLVMVYYKRRNYTRLQLRLGIVVGVMLFFLPFGAVGAWAALDFDSAFLWMHQTLFSNDLWLMDPRTDLMIRMLPERFFMRIGFEAAAKAAAAALLVPMIIFIGTFDFDKFGKKKNI